GVKLDISNQIAGEAEEALRKMPSASSSIKNISSKVEGWSSKVYVTLQSASDRPLSLREVMDRVRIQAEKVMAKHAQYKAFCYLSQPQAGKEIAVDLFGYDYDRMADLGLELAGRMERIAGLSDVKIRYRPGRPQL